MRRCDAGDRPECGDLLLERSRWVLDREWPITRLHDPEAIRLTGDKAELARHWHGLGVQTPPRFSDTCRPRRSGHPGFASHAAAQARKPHSWFAIPATGLRCSGEARGMAGGRPCLHSNMSPGTAASVAFLVGPGQCVPLMPAMQNLSEEGRFHYLGGQTLPVPLHDRAVRLARSAIAGVRGLQGYVGVDLVLGTANDGSEDYAIEINPRLTTSYIGSRELCRDNLARAWLDVLQGNQVTLTWHDGIVTFGADGSVA